MANTELTTVEEVKSMLSYWYERLANSVRPKHIKIAGQRISELQRELARLYGPTPGTERGEK